MSTQQNITDIHSVLAMMVAEQDVQLYEDVVVCNEDVESCEDVKGETPEDANLKSMDDALGMQDNMMDMIEPQAGSSETSNSGNSNANAGVKVEGANQFFSEVDAAQFEGLNSASSITSALNILGDADFLSNSAQGPLGRFEDFGQSSFPLGSLNINDILDGNPNQGPNGNDGDDNGSGDDCNNGFQGGVLVICDYDSRKVDSDFEDAGGFQAANNTQNNAGSNGFQAPIDLGFQNQDLSGFGVI